MPNAYVKVNGTMGTIYIDPNNNALYPLQSYEDVPVGAFPYTATLDELPSRLMADLGINLGAYTVVKVERVRREQPTLTLTPEMEVAADKAYDEMLEEARKKQGVSAAPASRKGSPFADTDTILRAFAALDEADVEAVGSFLINLAPDIEGALVAARQTPTAPPKRFKLG